MAKRVHVARCQYGTEQIKGRTVAKRAQGIEVGAKHPEGRQMVQPSNVNDLLDKKKSFYRLLPSMSNKNPEGANLRIWFTKCHIGCATATTKEYKLSPLQSTE